MTEVPGASGNPDRQATLLPAPSQYAEALAPVTECMLALARISPGQRVLDVGSGAGDMALAAARIVGPSGHVVATDVSMTHMADFERGCGEAFEPGRVEFVECAAEALALEPGAFDVALARNCVMYFTDLGRALGNIRACLKPGGRFVASVYAPLDHEPFHAIPVAAVLRRRALTGALPQYVQAFRLDADELLAAMRDSGFQQVSAQSIATTRTYPSVEELLAQLRQSHSCGELLACLPQDDVRAAWKDIERDFRRLAAAGSLVVRGEQAVLAALA